MSLLPYLNKHMWVQQLLPFFHISNDWLLQLCMSWIACQDWIHKTMVFLRTPQQFRKWLYAIWDSPLAHIESKRHPPILAKTKLVPQNYQEWSFDILSVRTRLYDSSLKYMGEYRNYFSVTSGNYVGGYDRGWILEKFEEARPNARYTER